MIPLYIVAIILWALLHIFFGYIIAHLITDEDDMYGTQFYIAVFWPLLLVGVIAIELASWPKRIANQLKKRR